MPLILCITNCYASNKRILILHNNYTKEFANKVSVSLQHQNVKSKNIDLKEINGKLPLCDNFDLIITVGQKGLEAALNKSCNTPILASLIYSHSYHSLASEYKFKMNRKITAIFIEQPLVKQFNLIKAIAYHTQANPTVGVILGPYSSQIENEILSESAKQDIKTRIIKVEKNEPTINALDKLSKTCSLLLTVPDPDVYNIKTSHGILLTAYNRKIPVIGYSKSYVNVGALASIYSSKSQHARDTAELSLKLLDKKMSFNQLHYPKRYSVAINYIAARTLNIDIKNTEIIKHYLAMFNQYSLKS